MWGGGGAENWFGIESSNIIKCFESDTVSNSICYNSLILHCVLLCYGRALCHLKLCKYEEAKQDCDHVLQIEDTNIKAFYRRALAYKGLQVRIKITAGILTSFEIYLFTSKAIPWSQFIHKYKQGSKWILHITPKFSKCWQNVKHYN